MKNLTKNFLYYIYIIMKIKIKETFYRGRPVLSLYDLDASEDYRDYPVLTIGIRKAKAILAVTEEIKNFVSKGEKNGKIHSTSKDL